MTPQHDLAFQKVLAHAAQRVPTLQVVVTSDCRDREWLVDSCCTTIYIPHDLPEDRAAGALTEAVDALVDDQVPVAAGLLTFPHPRSSAFDIQQYHRSS